MSPLTRCKNGSKFPVPFFHSVIPGLMKPRAGMAKTAIPNLSFKLRILTFNQFKDCNFGQNTDTAGITQESISNIDV